MVEQSSLPLTAAQAARALNLHHNTVREHLDALVEADLVTVSANPTGRRGRPALRYAPAGPDPAQVTGSYLALLDAVVEQLGDGESARSRALEIGRRWARLTPPEPTAATTQAADPAIRLKALLPHLSLMGFAPDFDGERIILKACPLVTGSRPPHPLVCVMHEGFLNERYAQSREDTSNSAGEQGAPTAFRRFALTPLCADGCHVTAATETETADSHPEDGTAHHPLKR